MNKIFKKWYWRDLYYKIKNFFIPPQRWLIKKLKGDFRDKDHILEIVVLECIKNYVTEEIGVDELFRENRWTKKNRTELNGINKPQIKFENELKKIYKLITIRLPELERQLEEEWDKLPKLEADLDKLMENLNNPKQTYKQKYGKIDKIEAKITNLKIQCMNWAVLNRNSMWT